MKKEEAIKMLKSKMDGSVDTSYEWAETVRMAIEALQAELTHGRPIDANALKKYFFRPYSNEESYSNIDIAKIIDNAPTISVEAISEDTQTKTELEHIKVRLENVEKKLQGLILYGFGR